MDAILALEDGRIFHGESFGGGGTSTGEICFNTSMTGYQEVLTDPSYCGQIVAMTYPLIGNYGVTAADDESCRPFVRGFIVEEVSPVVSNWRAEGALEDYLVRWNIPGLQGVDTRALTRHLRELGAMRACLTSELSPPAAVETAKKGNGVIGMDFMQEVSTPDAYDWDASDSESGDWAVRSGPDADGAVAEISLPLPPIRHRIVAMDFGVKRNILRRLRQAGFAVRVLPAHSSPEEILAGNPDGIFLSNGPGDPSALKGIHATLRELIGKKPIFGICLGHQLLALAMGGSTFKLKFGHRGGNQPVKDLRTGRVSITSQNHGFAVDPESLPGHVEVSHINLNDGTVEGLRHTGEPVMSVQYHPEAAPGPNDARYFFGDFSKMIDDFKNTR